MITQEKRVYADITEVGSPPVSRGGAEEAVACCMHFLSLPPFLPRPKSLGQKGSVLIVGLSYGARNVLSYSRYIIRNVLTFRDNIIIPLRCPPRMMNRSVEWND